MSELSTTIEEQNRFNFKVKSLILRKEFQLGNIYFNDRNGLALSSAFDDVEETNDAQKKHRIYLTEQLKAEGFKDCGEIYGFSKI